MNYELIVKLFDAKFPKVSFHVTKPNAKYPHREGQSGAPNLSELIGACPEFSSLTKSSRGNWYCAKSVDGKYELVVGNEYKSPEEAVANLWLELNK